MRDKAEGAQAVCDDEIDEDAVYRFGWREKTRFEPVQLFLKLNPDRGFELAPDPDDNMLENLRALLIQHGPVSKTEAEEVGKDAGLGGAKKIRALLKKGEKRYWNTQKGEGRNSQLVVPIQNGKPATSIGSAELPICASPEKQRVYTEVI